MKKPRKRVLGFLFSSCLLAVTSTQAFSGFGFESPAADQETGTAQVLDLSKSIHLALENNRRGKISKEDVNIALARRGQALSSWWPHLRAKVLGTQMDQDPNFIFPATQIPVPPTSIAIAPTTISIPANAFAPGFPQMDIPLLTPPFAVDLPAQEIRVPRQDIKVMDRSTLWSGLSLEFPVYTGGLRTSRIKQAEFGVEAARQEDRRTDLEVIYDVKRIYYAVLLANRLVQIGEDTLARMEATLRLTEELYQAGSGTVKKTDYLRNSSVVETLRGVVAELKSNEKTALAALVNVIGLDWNSRVDLVQEAIPFVPRACDPDALVENAYLANPEIAKVEAAIQAAKQNVRAARSGYLPKIGFVGSAHAIVNGFDAGIVTPENKLSWTLGLGVDLPIFEGFRVRNEMQEAKARLYKLEHQLSLLRGGIALNVMRTCHELEKTQEQQRASSAAVRFATENRELNVRAYQQELVETSDVIQAQLMEALLSGQYEKVLYQHIEEQSRLDFVLGSEVRQ